MEEKARKYDCMIQLIEKLELMYNEYKVKYPNIADIMDAKLETLKTIKL